MTTGSQRPGLSIVVNNYNYADYIAASLDSALAQMDVRDELIVVDDGSTDNSLLTLKPYVDAQLIRLIEQRNQGQMKAVRAGIESARCDVIVLLDSDDYLLDGYLDRLREIYGTQPDVSFVFSKAEVFGTSSCNPAQMRRSLEKMEFPQGLIGPTRWATLLFFEYVGAPTSGVSFRRGFAERVLALPAEVDATVSLSPLMRKLLGISLHEAERSGFNADGVIVRCASAVDETKYYNGQPGFAYRIHGANKYASAPLRGRLYLREIRKRKLVRLFTRTFGIEGTATAVELGREIRNRSWPRYRLRRLRLRAAYFLAGLKSRGSLRDKLSVAAAALGTGGKGGD